MKKLPRVPKSGSSRADGSLAVVAEAISASLAAAPAPVTSDTEKPAEKVKRTTRKKGTTEENSARIPRVRQVYALMIENQKRGVKKYPSNPELGRFLDPEKPLGENAVRAVLDMMRDDLGMPVDFIPEKGGHGFTEPVAGFPLDTISEDQAYALIQAVQTLRALRDSKAYADLRNAMKRACLGICFALNIDFEDIEAALSFHVVGFHAPAPVNPELFKTAMRAILQKKEVTLEHRSVKRPGEVMTKKVEALHLAMINHALYFFHYDPSLEGKVDMKGKPIDPIRKFALTRISGLTPTRRTCKETREFDVYERVNRGMGAFDDEDIVEVELLFSAKVAPFILERPFHPTEVVTKGADGSLSVKIRVATTPELDAAVVRWAGNVEVKGPARYRKHVRELGEALAAGNA